MPFSTLRAAVLAGCASLLLTAAVAQAQTPPSNDDCTGAIPVPVTPMNGACTPFVASNANATATPGVADPGCAYDYQGGDVWYSVTVPASGALRVRSSAVAGSAVDDTQLTLYTGTCGALTELDCNDDIDWDNYFSQIIVSGRTPGEVLYLRAATFGNLTSGPFGLCVQELPPCAGPTSTSVRVDSPTRATVTFATNALARGYEITYTPVGGTAQTVSSGGPSEQLSGLTPNTTYTVQVASDCGGTMLAGPPITFTTDPSPAYDECAGALLLPVLVACTSPTVISTDGATASAGVAAPACANYQGGDVWLTVTVPANGVLMLETSEVDGSNIYDTGMAVYSGSCGSLAELACDDNNSGVSLSYLRLTGRTPGEVLYVRAWRPGNYNAGAFAVCATTDDALPVTTWSGAVSTDWFAAGNWSAGVPATGTDAYIPIVGTGRYPVLDNAAATATVHTLSVDKYAGFSLLSGTLAVSGNVRCREPYARFLNTSNFPYTGGVLTLNGSAPQQVSGIGEMFELRMNSTSTATLTQQLRVDHRVTMDGGILYSGLGWIELYNENPFAGEFFSSARLVHESETSYVIGRIQTRRGVSTGMREDFSGLGMSMFTSSGNTPGLVRLNRYTGTAQTNVGGQAGILRAYNVEAGRDSGLDLTLDFQYFAHERNGLADADLRPYSSPGGLNGPWTAETGSTRLPPVAPDSASTIRLTGLTHLSGWTLGAPASTLPVRLTSFTATSSGPDALLRWTTASETDNQYFEVEVSPDGRTFAPVGRVAGAGTSATARQYQLRHAGVARYGAPVLYYRVHQVDYDGRGSYSPVRTLAVPAAGRGQLSAFPNPFGETLTVQLPAPASGPAQVVLHDALGRECLRQTTTLPAAGEQQISVPNVAKLPPGLYRLTLTLPGQTLHLNVIRR